MINNYLSFRSKISALYLLLPFLLLHLTTVYGQVSITYDAATNTFPAYNENFAATTANKLPVQKATSPATTNAKMRSLWTNGSTGPSTIPGWYLGVEKQNIRQFYLYGNDSSLVDSAPYSYGLHDDSERSLGFKGQAGQAGVFFAALRMKNTTTQTIKDFEIQFAVEQWYYSGEVTQVDLEYAIGPNVVSATTTSVSWYPLDVISTPITAGAARTTNGNRNENRVVKTVNLKDINLPAGQEIVFRWALKITSNRTKFNGVALDDVTVTPSGITTEAPVIKAVTYYNKTDKHLDDTRSWGTNPDGSGTNPRNFTDPEQTFVVINMPDKVGGKKDKYREDDYTLSIKSKDGWLVSGTNSKVVLGDGVKELKMAIHKDKFYTGPLELKDNTTLIINTSKKVAKMPKFVALAPTSTVVYSDSTDLDIANIAYGNLVVLGNEYSKQNNVVNGLSASLAIKGKLELNGKKINLNDKSLTILGEGSLVNMNASSYLIANGVGTLNQLVPTAHETTFPVGTSEYYMPVKIKGGAKAVNYKVAVKNGVANASTHNGSTQTEVSGNTWVIEKEQLAGGSPDASISLQWTDKPTETAVNSAANLFIGKYNSTTNTWELKKVDSYQKNPDTGLNEITFTDNFAGTTTSGLNAVSLSANLSRMSNSTMATTATTYQRGEYAIYKENLPMPVELVSFTATRSNSVTNLTWKTAMEKDNSHFEVEFSTDSRSFVKAGEVKGQGNSSVANHYKFNHQANITGTIYYRLKQVDFDGKTSYSKVVTVEAKKLQHQAIAVAPNPTAGKVTLYLPSADNYALTVVSSQGRVITKQVVPTGQQQVDVNLDAQPAGTYIVRLQNGDNISTNKVIKY